jgi:hypothetical protein
MIKFWKVFSWPIRRLKVDESVLVDFQKELESALSMQGIIINIPRSDALLKRLVEEAYSRASRGEPDGIPRNGPMEDQVDEIVDKIVQVWRGNIDADRVINTIMVQYGLKSAP